MQYFVSFFHAPPHGGFGISAAVVSVDGPMTERDLGEIRASLERQHPGEQIAIMNFQPLG